jgi:hypothetical protein
MAWKHKLLGRILILTTATLAFTSPTAQAGDYAVVERGLDYQVLQKTEVVNGTNRVHQYTHLATGLNYTNASGQLIATKEEITILPTGGAAATQGRHHVYFPGNLYNGVLQVVTPDGRNLFSRPLGVTYDDGSNTVFIATLTNAVGYLTKSNQVTYRNCFTGIKADLVCTYHRNGIESDLVFRQQPPAPAQFGMDADNCTLQLVTEFFNTQDPQAIPGASDDWYGLQDNTLRFGGMTMRRGKAFAFNGTNSLARASSVPVYKRWLKLDGRKFLIEEVPVVDMAEDLEALPLMASTVRPSTSTIKLATGRKSFPPAHSLQTDTNQVLLAKADFSREPGYVLDWFDSLTPYPYWTSRGYGNNYTFHAGTYLLSGWYYFGGHLTFEGGAVIKFDANTTDEGIDTDVLDDETLSYSFPDDPSNPVIFTSSDDNSVGDVVNGSTGNPIPGNFFYIGGFNCSGTVQNARFYYMGGVCACVGEPGGLYTKVVNCEFWYCYDCCIMDHLELHNVLFAHCQMPNLLGNSDSSISAEHVTMDDFQAFYTYGMALCLTNCLFTSNTWVSVDGGTWTNAGGSIYRSGGYYLATTSPYRNVGVPNISPELAQSFNALTTYAPADGNFPDNDGQPDLGYHYPVTDSDHDGLADWWEWKYFGSYSYKGTNVDASGNTLLADYQSYLSGTPVDPNVIQFSVGATNDHVNTTTAHVQLAITAGHPSFYAVLVNDATTTNWQTFTTTNLTVNLGSTDGVYNVEVGLKGLPADATQTWADYRFILDRVFPKLTITNPVLTNGAATLIKPYLQIKGFADKQLATLSYDITNANGIFTNQDAFVTDQGFDTNKFDFTTNYFQAYDVPLATNNNHITFRVTDWAGNTTTTNFNLVLDYTGATNLPVVSLIWPTNGMAVCGTNCTIQGTMSDETGTIQATVVNGFGTVDAVTNSVTGLVERNGMFWIEGVPLNGTSHICLQATDASGKNVTTTNFSVNPSTIQLTVDSMPTGDALWEPSGTVGGTVSDPNAVVIINTKIATVNTEANDDGTYDWTADHVPISGGGTATFNATATPMGQTAPAGNVNNTAEKESMIKIVSYNDTQEDKYYSSTGLLQLDWKWTKTYTAKYQQGLNIPSTHHETADEYLLDIEGFEGEVWYDWLDNNPGTYDVEYSNGIYDYDRSLPDDPDEVNENYMRGKIKPVPDENYVKTDQSGTMWSADIFVSQYYADKAHYQWDWQWGGVSTSHEDLTVKAHTAHKLFTGGKSGRKRQNLFCISCSAGRMGQPATAPWLNTSVLGIDKAKLTVLGKHSGADGNLWIMLPEDADPDVTVTAPERHYDAKILALEYHPYIGLTTSTVNANLDNDKPEVCVGQTVTLGANWFGGVPPATSIDNVWWNLPDKYVNQQANYSSTCSTYVKNTDLLTNAAIQCWYVNGDGKADDCSVRETLHFANGQSVIIAAVGIFKVFRPQKLKENMSQDLVTPKLIQNIPSPPLYATNVNGLLALGDAQGGYARFWAKYYSSYPGEFQEAQILKSYRKAGNDDPVDSGSLWWNDHAWDKGGIASTVSSGGGEAWAMQIDNPAWPLKAPQTVVNDIFKTYFQFKPSGDGIWVTMGRVDWSWAATSTYTGGQWNPPSGTPIPNPQYYDDDSFPLWDGNHP